MKKEDLDKLLKSLDEYLDSDEFKEDMEKQNKERIQKEKSERDYFESHDFFALHKKLIKSKIGSIGSDDFNYQKEESFPITKNEFYLIFDSIQRCCEPNVELEEDEEDFPTQEYKYKGLVLREIHGQGTICIIDIESDADKYIVEEKIKKF